METPTLPTRNGSQESEAAADTTTVVKSEKDPDDLVVDLDVIRSVVASQCLASVILGDYLVVMRSDFDVVLFGEPYLAAMLLFNLKTGSFIARLWNQTVMVAKAVTREHFEEACRSHFGRGKPCLGHLEEGEVKQEYLASHTPVPRRVSKECRRTIGKDTSPDTVSCEECQKLKKGSNSDDQIDRSKAVKRKVEIDHQENDLEEKKARKLPKVPEPSVELSDDENACDFTFNDDFVSNEEEVVIGRDPAVSDIVDEEKKEIDDDDFAMPEPIIVTQEYQRPKVKTTSKRGRPRGRPSKYESSMAIKVVPKDMAATHECAFCGQHYMSSSGLEEHIKKRHSSGLMTCDTCGKPFRKKSEFMRHVKSHLRQKGVSEDEAKMSLWYYCDKCGKKFHAEYYLEKHIREVHEGAFTPATCPVCDVTFENFFKMRDHKREAHPKKKQQCEHCGEHVTSLKTHIALVHEDPQFGCDACDMKFNTKKKLLSHHNVEHATDVQFQCQKCGKRCGSASQLRLHARVHEEPHLKCRYCEKKVKSRKALTAHEFEHTGERPFVCDICNSGFKSSCALYTHKTHVHKVVKPGTKPSFEKRVRKRKDF